jgi:hypothetical protein
MTIDWQQSRGPSPEQLAAYTDGELHDGERAQIEAWLVEHPRCAAEVEASRRLMRLWDSTAPNTPAPPLWDAALDRIQARLPSSPRMPGTPNPWRTRIGWGVAAALVLVMLSRPLWEVPASFPVATSQDVTILSMDARDTGSLVVGHPPILGPIDLANHGDVVLLSMPDPDIHLDDWAAPMIVDPKALVGDGDR